MRLLVAEFISGGGLANHPLPESLKQEGLMMLQALIADCSRIPDVELQTSLDSRINLDLYPVNIKVISAKEKYLQTIKQLAKECDYTWIIAPESEGVLEQMIAELSSEKTRLINCDAHSIGICADKLICNQYLYQSGIAVIPIITGNDLADYQDPVIVKKRDGVGCEEMQIFDNGEKVRLHGEDASSWIVQPYIEGEHKSLSVLCLNGDVCVLSCNQQILNESRQPYLKACLVNQCKVTNKHEKVAMQIAKSLPGLKGYVGIDFVETNNEIFIVDINPRLSTSYVGLSKVLDINPAFVCFEAVVNNKLPKRINRNKKSVEVNLG